MVYVLDRLLYSLTNWPKHLLAYVKTDQSEPSKSSTTTTTTTTATAATTTSADATPTAEVVISQDDSSNETDSKRRKLEAATTKDDSELILKPDSRFFKRTESVLVSREKDSNIQMSNNEFFGVEGGANLALENPELVGPPNQWGEQVESFSRPLNEEYPLASRPHLLKPFAKKEVLFGGGMGEGAKDSLSAGGGQEEGGGSPGKNLQEGTGRIRGKAGKEVFIVS